MTQKEFMQSLGVTAPQKNRGTHAELMQQVQIKLSQQAANAQREEVERFKSSIHSEDMHDAVMRATYGSYGQYVAQQIEKDTSLSDGAKANLISYYGITDRDTIKKNTTTKKGVDTGTPGQSSVFQDFVKGVNNGTIKVNANISDDAYKQWGNSVTDVTKRAYEYLKIEGYKQPDTSLAEELDKYLSQAADIGQYMRANKLRYKDYDKAYESYVNTVNSLKALKEQLDKQNTLFSNLKTEQDYEDYKIGWLYEDAEMTLESVEARKNRYEANEKRIDELDNMIENFNFDYSGSKYEWGTNADSNIPVLKFKTKANNRAEYDALVAERDNLKAQNEQYRNMQQKRDDYYVPETPEFLANGSYRNYSNPSREDLDRINANQDYINDLLLSGNNKWDSDGNIVNIYTGKVEYSADDLSRAMLEFADSGDAFNGGFFDTDESDNYIDHYYDSIVQDKLGMFLSASEDDIVDAYSELASRPTSSNNTWARILQEGDQNSWAYLTEYELNVYYDLYKTRGQDAAYKFLDDMTVILSRRRTMEEDQELADASGLERLGQNVLSIPANIIGGGIAFVEDTANIIKGEKINPYSRAHSMQNYAQSVRKYTAEEINDWSGGAKFLGIGLDDVYQAGMSGADALFGSIALGGTAYAVLMGMGAASLEAKSLYEKGASQSQIIAGGLLAGAAEMVFEKVSIGRFTEKILKGEIKSVLQIIKNSLIQGGVEASEEALTEISNTITDAIVMGSQSDWEQNIQKYIEDGKNRSEASALALLDVGKNVWKAGIGGFISGGGTSSLVTTTNYLNGKITGKFDNVNIAEQTNAVSKPLSSYSIEKRNSIISFIGAVDEKLKTFVQSVKGGDLTFKRQKISDVSERAANDIGNLLGIDVSDYTHDINTNSVQHILNRHGENGEYNHTMSNDNDIARIGWVLENYDTVELLTKDGEQVYSSGFLDGEGKPAPQIRYIKRIDGTYYVVEAAVENNYKKLWVQSAYLQKTKEDVTRTAADGNSTDHDANARSASVSPSSNNTVSQSKQTVNNNIPKRGGDNSSYVDGGENQSYNSNDNNNLTPEQKERYDAAILRYKSSESYKINSKLREDEVLTEEELEFVNTLDEALEQLPTYEGTVYRQIIFDDFGGEEAFNEFLLEHTPGKFIFYEQYTSCSTAEDGYTVEGNYKISFIVEGKNARNVDGYGNNMEKEVIFPRNTMFIVQDIDTSGKYPIIYLQEDVENGYSTNEEQGETVRDLQASHSVHGDMQGVSEENTAGNRIGQVRPQSAASGGQRNTVRAERGNGTLLSAKSEEREVNTDGESVPTGGRVLDMPAITVKQQNFVKKIGKALGRNVEFVNMERFLKEHDVDTEKLKIYPDGAIDGKGNIYIWYNAEKPVQFLFKHELTHFGERSKYYKRFVEFVRSSKIYEEWMREKVKTSESYKEWLKKNPQEVGKELRTTQVEGFLKQDHIDAQSKLKEEFGKDDALAEVIADFVGENCFGESLKGLETLIDEANLNQHSSAIQYLVDFFAYLKKKLSGNKQITFELSRIEDSFRRLIYDANKTKTPETNVGGLRYSTAKSFSEQVDDVISGIHNPRLDLYVSQTPQYLVDLNFSDGPLLIRNSKIFEILEKHPEISQEVLKDLPNAIEKPLLVLKSKTHPTDSVVVITEIMTTKGEMIIPVWANQEGSYIDVDLEVKNEKTNFVASSYGRDIKTLLEYASENDGFLYQNANIEKVRQLLARNGLQLPTPLMLSDSDITVSQKEQFVNSNSTQESENYSSKKNGMKFSIATENETDTDTQSIDFTDEVVEKYTESQYNNFGWVRANDVLSATAYNLFKQKVAEIRTGVRFPKSRYGEYIIAVGNQSGIYNILVYTDGDMNEPYIRKVIEIRAENQYIADLIRSEIYDADNGKLWDAVQYVKDVFGEENIDEYKSRDFPSFRQYSRREKRNLGIQNGENDGGKQNGGRTNKGGGTIPLKFSMATDERNGTSTDFTAEFDALMQSFQNGEISQDEYMRRVSELYQESIDENGEIRQGEMVTPQDNPFAVPKSVNGGTKVRQHVSRILESGRATPEQENVFKEMILDGKFSYTPTSNETNIKKAEKVVEKEGYQKAKKNWEDSIVKWTADADTVAKGEALLQLAFEQKNAVDIVNLAAELAELGTHIGQGLQAMSLVKRMGGLGQLVYLERCVARINESLEKRIKKGKAEVVTIDSTLAQQLAESKTEAEFEITYAAIVKDIAAQVPSTFADKWNALRYVCMLFNPVTHIRNIVGNAIFLPGVRIKDLLAVGMEKGVSKNERTKVVKVKKEYQEYAEKDFAEVADLITGTGKYNPSDEIRSNQRVFKPKWLEAARKFNFDMLEKEDALFLKRHYKHALGGYLQAQGIDLREVTPNQLTKAREYAMQEAMKATYRDASKAANMISRFAKTNAVTEIIVEGLLPYKKTPINIIKRGVEYSPIGLVKTLSKGIYDLKQGNITTTQFIDGLASGLTGTGICIVGALLASLGVVKGGFDDEEKWFRKLNGEQEYSIQIGNFSYTIDWATPASIPLFLGVAIAEYDANEDADILSSIWDFGMASFEPLLNLSLLSGLEDAIAAVSYADDGEKITSFLGTTMESYFAQFLPTVFGKTANLFDDTRRTTYIDKTSNVPAVIQEAWNKVVAKIPIANQTRAEYIDAWGETQYTGNFLQRFIQQFASPGYASTINVDDTSQELMRIYKQTGESGVFPSTPRKYFTVKGMRRDLSKEEYFDYATFKGQTQADLVDEAIHSEQYSALTDEQKVEVIKDIYSYSGALAKCQLDYSYEEIAAMQGEDKKGNIILTEDKYNRLDEKARQILIDEYFMESSANVKAYKYAKNGRSVVEYFCGRAKE